MLTWKEIEIPFTQYPEPINTSEITFFPGSAPDKKTNSPDKKKIVLCDG
jgi:hypothetical protein